MSTNKTFRDLEIGKKYQRDNTSLGKRKFNEAFSEIVYDELRYGQKIDDNFFKYNLGNNCSTWEEALEEGKMCEDDMNIKKDVTKKIDVEEILAWCEYYLANRKIFKI
jgi:hypothetical protein